MSDSDVTIADPALLIDQLNHLDQARRNADEVTIAEAEADLRTVINEQLGVARDLAQTLRYETGCPDPSFYHAALQQTMGAHDQRGTPLGNWWEKQLDPLVRETYSALSCLQAGRRSYLSGIDAYISVLNNAQRSSKNTQNLAFAARIAESQVTQGRMAYEQSSARVDNAAVRYNQLLQEYYANLTQEQPGVAGTDAHDQAYESEWGSGEGTAYGSEDEASAHTSW